MDLDVDVPTSSMHLMTFSSLNDLTMKYLVSAPVNVNRVQRDKRTSVSMSLNIHNRRKEIHKTAAQ